MPLLKMYNNDGYLSFDELQCRAAGKALMPQFVNASPFPHIMIDGFLDPAILRNIAFPPRPSEGGFNRPQERFKYQFQPQECAGATARNLFAELNSCAFLGFLSELTGIKDLISDAYFCGAGLHETLHGGHLGVHADFNKHGTMGVERRLNLLIYLNEDWDESYGGALELWDAKMRGCEVKIAPVMSRAVIFRTDLQSFHGHPDPLSCPPDRSRRSLATYYYSMPQDGRQGVDRTTNFRPRPGTADRRDWKLMMRHFTDDWLPPALRRR